MAWWAGHEGRCGHLGVPPQRSLWLDGSLAPIPRCPAELHWHTHLASWPSRRQHIHTTLCSPRFQLIYCFNQFNFPTFVFFPVFIVQIQFVLVTMADAIFSGCLYPHPWLRDDMGVCKLALGIVLATHSGSSKSGPLVAPWCELKVGELSEGSFRWYAYCFLCMTMGKRYHELLEKNKRHRLVDYNYVEMSICYISIYVPSVMNFRNVIMLSNWLYKLVSELYRGKFWAFRVYKCFVFQCSGGLFWSSQDVALLKFLVNCETVFISLLFRTLSQ